MRQTTFSAKAYHQAYEAARQYAVELGHAVGLEAANEYGRKVFRIALIPNDPNKRFGWEAWCEVVLPTDPKVAQARSRPALNGCKSLITKG